jgi:hypothetical protein
MEAGFELGPRDCPYTLRKYGAGRRDLAERGRDGVHAPPTSGLMVWNRDQAVAQLAALESTYLGILRSANQVENAVGNWTSGALTLGRNHQKAAGVD